MQVLIPGERKINGKFTATDKTVVVIFYGANANKSLDKNNVFRQLYWILATA